MFSAPIRKKLLSSTPLKKALPTILGVLCLVAIGVGINAFLAARNTGASAEAPSEDPMALALPVETYELSPTDSLKAARTFTGQIVARQTTNLAFEGSGRIVELLADEGEFVEAGQVLGRLDQALLLAQRKETAARRVRLEAQLEELLEGPREESIDAARAGAAAVQEELDLAVAQRDRRADLAAKGTISAELLDTTRAAVKQVEARLAAAKAQLAELENGTREETVAAQRGALLELDAALESIDVAITHTELKAPFAGTIAARHLDLGSVVSLQMPSAAFRLVETGSLEAHIGVPVELAPTTEAGADDRADAVRLLLRGQTIEILHVRARPNVDPGTRTVTVIYELDPKTAKAADARPGDVIALERTTTRPEVGAWIPLTALSESERGLWSAFAVARPAEGRNVSTAERIELEVLTADETHAFVRGTFSGPTTVVASGVNRLVPGQRIRPVVAAETSAPLK